MFIRKIRATSWFKCVSCKEQIRTDENCIVVERADGRAVLGERYCCGCERYAKLNNSGMLFKVEGDNRWFVETPNGTRCGEEHTGQRCEDAPCCGCC